MNRFAFFAFALFTLVLGLSMTVYTFQKCGVRALWLGNGSLYAAASGMCDR